MIDLSSLPDPQVIEELDYETILQGFIDDVTVLFAAAGIDYDVGALETDPVKIVLEAFSYREIRLRTRANDVARNQILAYSTGTDLEHLASHYGVARLAGETDDRLRERVQLATIGRSPGGTHERFKAIAMASSPKVRDIATWAVGRDPTVNIAVLSTDVGGAASASLLATVRAALEDPEVRLVSDRYNVISAVQKVVAVDLSVTLTPDASEDILAELPDLIRQARDQEDLLGLDLYRAWVSKAAMVSGVSNVVVNAPVADVVASPEEAVKIGDVTIQFSGRGR
ncbi:baseplate J/gp47 family protein [Roseibium algicola]|uniref:baseplate J/gp47 family protein n=1 Tax=Roseibium algicola TaxID=2857014 RepID=UPI0034589BB7